MSASFRQSTDENHDARGRLQAIRSADRQPQHRDTLSASSSQDELRRSAALAYKIMQN